MIEEPACRRTARIRLRRGLLENWRLEIENLTPAVVFKAAWPMLSANPHPLSKTKRPCRRRCRHGLAESNYSRWPGNIPTLKETTKLRPEVRLIWSSGEGAVVAMYADPFTAVGLLKGKRSVKFSLLKRLLMLKLIFDWSKNEFLWSV